MFGYALAIDLYTIKVSLIPVSVDQLIYLLLTR